MGECVSKQQVTSQQTFSGLKVFDVGFTYPRHRKIKNFRAGSFFLVSGTRDVTAINKLLKHLGRRFAFRILTSVIVSVFKKVQVDASGCLDKSTYLDFFCFVKH